MKTKRLAVALADALQQFVALDPEIVAKVQRHLEQHGVRVVIRGYLQPDESAEPTRYFLHAGVTPKGKSKPRNHK